MSIRGEVWPFLLRYYSPESTSEEREALRVRKRKEYEAIQQKRYRGPAHPTELRRKMALKGQLEVQFSIDNMFRDPWLHSRMGLPGAGAIGWAKCSHYATPSGLWMGLRSSHVSVRILLQEA